MIQDFGKLLLIGVIMCYIASLFFGLITLYGFDWIARKNPYGLFRKKDEKNGIAGENSKNGQKADLENPVCAGDIPVHEPGVIEKKP